MRLCARSRVLRILGFPSRSSGQIWISSPYFFHLDPTLEDSQIDESSMRSARRVHFADEGDDETSGSDCQMMYIEHVPPPLPASPFQPAPPSETLDMTAGDAFIPDDAEDTFEGSSSHDLFVEPERYPPTLPFQLVEMESVWRAVEDS